MQYSARLGTVAMVGAQAMLAAALVTIVAGPAMGSAAVLAVTAVYLLGGGVLPKMVFRIAGAIPLSRYQAPRLYGLVAELANRAGLDRVPRLVYLPGAAPNAFTVGDGDQAVIGVSRGLLDTLDQRELAGVLAHEISHVRNGDTRLLGFAATMAVLCQNISLAGQVLLLINLPLVVSGQAGTSWAAIWLLMGGPLLSLLLQYGLSRAREYQADLEAVGLTGDPRALASALVKIEVAQRGLVKRLLWPLGTLYRPDTWYSTHPSTAKRVQRLMDLVPRKGRPLPCHRSPIASRACGLYL